MKEDFSVYQFFADGSHERVKHLVGVQEAVEAARNLSISVGGRLGTTQRIIITDEGDYCVFEWEFGKGITFPPAD